MDKVVQSTAVYDRIFSEGGYQGIYDLPYRHSAYYPLFKRVLRELVRHGSKSVLEVGCGTGAFAHMVLEKSRLAYQGFDFSTVAVNRAVARTRRSYPFYVGDATAASTYEGRHFDAIVCTEVLEHVERDLEAISKWKRGTFCICSVPNFDSETHVRYFRSAEEVRSRYGQLIDIERVTLIKKPVLSDISLPNVLRALRWNRYRPRRFMEILGIGTFESIGGWFLFSGTRR